MPSHTATTTDLFAPMMQFASLQMDTMATVSEAAVRTASEMTDTMFRFAEEALSNGGSAHASMGIASKGRPVDAEPGQRVKRAASTTSAAPLSTSRPAARAGRSWYRAPARTPLETWSEAFGYSTDMTRAWGDAAGFAQAWNNCMAPVVAATNAMTGQSTRAPRSAVGAFAMPNWLTDTMKSGATPWSEMWTNGRPRAEAYEAFAPSADAARLFSDWLEAASKGVMSAWPTPQTIDVAPARSKAPVKTAVVVRAAEPMKAAAPSKTAAPVKPATPAKRSVAVVAAPAPVKVKRKPATRAAEPVRATRQPASKRQAPRGTRKH